MALVALVALVLRLLLVAVLQLKSMRPGVPGHEPSLVPYGLQAGPHKHPCLPGQQTQSLS